MIKKTTNWLQQHKRPFEFHDYRKEGISKDKLTEWCAQKGWETIFNKRSTTWKELPEAVQKKVTNEKEAIKVMMENTTIIKRPVLEKDGKLVAVGFNEKEYQLLL